MNESMTAALGYVLWRACRYAICLWSLEKLAMGLGMQVPENDDAKD